MVKAPSGGTRNCNGPPGDQCGLPTEDVRPFDSGLWHAWPVSSRQNILVSSAGRRVRLVKIAQAVARRRGAKVVATDVAPQLSAACQIADREWGVPRLSSDDFLPALYDIAHRENVGLIIPTLDTELLLLAGVRDEWSKEGIHISVSDPQLVTRCRDKWRTIELFESMGIQSPEVIDDDETYPRFIKPVSGSQSQDIHLVRGPDAYDSRWSDKTTYIQQRVVDRREFDEYSVDLYYRADGVVTCIIPRLRLEVRSGEISKGRTVRGHLLEFLKDRMSVLTGARGCVTAQFFVAKEPSSVQSPVLGIEVNPRFGGGYPLTNAAGGHYVEWLTNEYLESKPMEYTDAWESGLTMLRYDAEVFVR